MATFDKRNIDLIAEKMRIADEYLNLARQGFDVRYRSEKSEKLIYDTEWCRISLIWGGWDQAGGDSMHNPVRQTTCAKRND